MRWAHARAWGPFIPDGDPGQRGDPLRVDRATPVQSMLMRTDELDFELPQALTAQSPPPRRGDSRLMHYRRADRSVDHRTFSDLPGLLRPGDLLVFNDARVLPARFTLFKSTGGRVEGLFVSEVRAGRWRVLLKNLGNVSGRLRCGAVEVATADIAGAMGNGEYEI